LQVQGAGIVNLFAGDRAPFGTAGFETWFTSPQTHIWCAEGPGQTNVFNVTPGGSAYFAGNVGIGNNTPTNKLMVVNARCDGTTWINASDRNLKQDFAPVDPIELLAKVASMPVQSWSYKSHPEEKHVGPVAQDFHAAFGLGSDDKSIATVDEGGVALAAIQGLNQKVESEKQKSESLEQKLEQKETEITELKAQVSELKELVNTMDQKLNGEK
jgi:hypothetical protein